MASQVHCIACFEALDAHFSGRDPLSLSDIQSLWPEFKKTLSPRSSSIILKNPALAHISSSTTASSSSSSSPFSTPAFQSSTSTPTSELSSSSSLSLAPSTAATSIASSPSIVNPPLSSAPLFVTWNTLHKDDDDADDDDADDDDYDDDDDDDEEGGPRVSLRGCIGTFESKPLEDGVPEYALISALEDSRFSPIAPRELPTLQVAVTLLTDFEEAQDPRDWVVGLHGIRLAFRDGGRRFGATYLPDVAKEQGWSKDDALFSLVRKAGWMGSRSRWKELDLNVTRYQGKKISLSHQEYKKWRDWLASRR